MRKRVGSIWTGSRFAALSSLAALLAVPAAYACGNGTAFTSCAGCHTDANPFNSSAAFGSVPSWIAPGGSDVITFSVSATGHGAAGFAVEIVSGGAGGSLSATGGGTRLASGDVTHTDNNGAGPWSFTLNAPATVGGSVSLRGRGNAVNGTAPNPLDCAGGGTDGDDPTAQVSTASIDINSPPNAVNDARSVNEDSGTTSFNLGSGARNRITSNDTSGSAANDSGDSLRIYRVCSATTTSCSTSSFSNGNGTVTIVGSGSTAYVTFAPALDFNGTYSFDYQVRDSFDSNTYRDTAQVDITVNAVNDRPAIGGFTGDIGYTEDDPATTVDGNLTVTDVDDTLANSAFMAITGNCELAEDLLEVSAAVCSANNIACTQTTACRLDLASDSPPTDRARTAYQAVLRAVTYRNSSDAPSTNQRTVTAGVQDDGGSDSINVTKTISVAALADPPTVAGLDNILAYTENDPASLVDSSLLLDDPDSTNLNLAQIEIDGNCVLAEDRLAVSATACGANSLVCTQTSNCFLTLSGDLPLANYENVLETITYRNLSDNPDTTTRQLRMRVRDNGNVESIDYNTTITIAPVNDAPVALDDPALATDAGFQVDVGSSNNLLDVLANDSDVDGPNPASTITLVNGVAGPAATAGGGTVSINGTGNRVIYTPPAAAAFGEPPPLGTPDTFTYIISDNHPSMPLTAMATVTVRPTDGDADGYIDFQDNCPADSNSGQENNDGDSEGDVCDADDDNDGILDTDEAMYPGCLDAFDASDASEDCDGDGVSNIDEINGVPGGNPVVDDVPPEVTAPADMLVNASGYFTAVDLGAAMSQDAREGLITAVPRLNVNTAAVNPCTTGEVIGMEQAFRPGRFAVYWTAQDNGLSQGGTPGTPNCAYAIQMLDLRPLVSLEIDKFVQEGQTALIAVNLNGTPPQYPVTVSIGLGGTAAADDYAPIAASLQIAAGTSAALSVSTAADGLPEGDETLVVTLLGATQAALGRRTHTLTIAEGNVAPSLALAVNQGADNGPLVVQTDGTVSVTVTVSDPNPADTHSYDWSGSHNALADTNPLAAAFDFDPNVLTPGLYPVAVTVTDSAGASASARVLINVRASAPVLNPALDTDGDGTNDQAEGYRDSDGDGIADHLDHDLLPGNLLQTETEDATRTLLMEGEDGVVLTLGDTALYALRDGAMVTGEDVQQAGGPAGTVTSNGVDAEIDNVGGLFDFVIAGLVPGSHTRVVLPLRSAILANARYRKFEPVGGWRDFVEDERNIVFSAPRRAGVCPGPGDSAYRPGLEPFHECVQLRIEDGGPNDADGVADGVVRDPGGVGVVAIRVASPSTSSGSALRWLTVLLLAVSLFGGCYGVVRLGDR